MRERFLEFLDWAQKKGYDLNYIFEALMERIRFEELAESHGHFDIGWECYSELYKPLNPWVVRKLVDLGLAKVVYKSNRQTLYRFVDREVIKKLIEEFGKVSIQTEAEKLFTCKVPDDIFSTIIGYDDLKQFLLKVLKKIERGEPFRSAIPILLVGSPASGKSLFIDEVARVPCAVRISLAGITTRSGFIEKVVDAGLPPILLLDEIDKVKYKDALYPLLDIIEWRPLHYHAHHKHQVIEYKPKLIIAACNTLEALPEPIVSRFEVYQMRNYDSEEMVKIAIAVISRQYNIDPTLVEKLARKYVNVVRDVRQLITKIRVRLEVSELEHI